VTVQAIHCPACERRWPVGATVNDFERQVLESAPCPACGRHVLRCVPSDTRRGRGSRRPWASHPSAPRAA